MNADRNAPYTADPRRGSFCDPRSSHAATGDPIMKRSLKYALPAVALIAQGIDEPAHADDLFLQIDPAEGESVTQGYEGQIDVLAWSWAAENSGDAIGIGGGGGGGKANLSSLKIIKSVDAATPVLVTYATEGTFFDEAILTATRQTSKGNAEFMKMTLTTVLVSKVAHGGRAGDGDDGVAETLTLDYVKVCLEYRKFNTKTAEFDLWQESCWDRAKNASF